MPVFLTDQFGKGAVRDLPDDRDLKYEEVLGASAPFTEEDWKRGFDIEEKLNFKLPIKNQWSSLSCVGQAYSYYVAILNLVETGKYDEASAKAIYSQIHLPNGGAYFRDGAKLIVDFGALLERIVASHKADGSVDEEFMRSTDWITPEIVKMAEILQAKDYRSIGGFTMDVFAQAIRDNWGVVGGVEGENNGTWSSNEPRPPKGTPAWAHALYFGKFGIDEKGKFIATPNSWGTRNAVDKLHPDDWQKLREDWFAENGRFIFSPWTLTDKPNILNTITMDIKAFMIHNDLKFIRNQETGAFGRIIGQKLRVVKTDDRGTLLLLDEAVRKNGLNITNAEWEQLPKVNF